MNWKFIISWAVKFTLCLIVYDLTAYLSASRTASFWMALGFLILIAIAESYVQDWWAKRKEKLTKEPQS